MPSPRARRVAAVLLLPALVATGVASSAAQTTAPPVAAPELARFNDLLASLADQIKPGLVHVRVRRGSTDDKDPDEPRRARRRRGGCAAGPAPPRPTRRW